jgi:hypothetical protein
VLRLTEPPGHCSEAAARLDFLYERICQRPPSSEETALGPEFVNQTPLRDDPAAGALMADNNAGSNAAKPNPPKHPAGNIGKKRAPLTSWEEYAQALLQVNETSFVN